MSKFRTFGWIARQNPHIRILEDIIEDNHKFIFPELSDKSIKTTIEERKKWFAKGELWPTLILVEKGWDESGTEKTEKAFVRIFRNDDGAILDIMIGDSLDYATIIADEYKVPLFSVTCSRKGIRGTAQRIQLDII